MAGRCLTINYGPLYIQFERNATVLITRNDASQAIQLSLSEFMWMLKAAELHGWPIAPPSQFLQDYSLTVTDVGDDSDYQ